MPSTRKPFPVHELANALREANPIERAVLKDSIKIKGQMDPVEIYDGKLIDGRTRQDLCVELGMMILYEDIAGKLVDLGITIEDYVAIKNVNRRHLSPSDRAKAIARIFVNDQSEKRRIMVIMKEADVSKRTATRASASVREESKPKTPKKKQEQPVRETETQAVPQEEPETESKQECPIDSSASVKHVKVVLKSFAKFARDINDFAENHKGSQEVKECMAKANALAAALNRLQDSLAVNRSGIK